MSIRYTAIAEDGAASVLPRFDLVVRTRAGGWGGTGHQRRQLRYGGHSWAGLSGKLPNDVDWAHFQVRLRYRVNSFSLIGGANKVGPCVPGTLVVDSIGLGSDLVPYLYQQGTSMACPAVAGAAAVIAGQGLDRVSSNDPAKKAEKLAALVKGAAVPDARYEGLCSTAGRATVDGAASPGPAITEVVDGSDAVAVCGYFMPEGTVVLVDGVPVAVSACADLGDGKAELTVQKPEGFMGGQVVVRAEAGGKRASHRADLEKGASTRRTTTRVAICPSPTSWTSGNHGSWSASAATCIACRARPWSPGRNPTTTCCATILTRRPGMRCHFRRNHRRR